MTDNTGGPAFPASAGLTHITTRGMTLRDYFAAKAMQGWLSTYSCPKKKDEVGPIGLSKWSYEMADAMLKAREAA